jgi:hypothetical protein
MQRVRPPKTRLKTLLQLLVEVPAMAEKAMLTIPLPHEEAGKRLVLFDAGVLLRASNALRAIRLMCEQAHWEFTAATVRQLFELVLNMEHLATQPDREAAILRYAKYGLLQTVRHQHLNLLYDQKTGRSIDMQRLAVLESMLEHTFPEFRSVDDKGKVHWKPSWSGHSARYLAEQSEHPLREDQYHLLFVMWSEQAHGAPAALMDNMFPRGLPVDEIVASDDARIIQTVTTGITLFFELWMLLPYVPQVDAAQRLEWTNRMVAEARTHGAPFPAPGPVERRQ